MTKPTKKNQKKKCIAFFPWVAIDQPLTAGPVRLIPYEQRCTPGDLKYVKQAELDGVLSAYADRPRVIVRKATLLEIDDWQLGEQAESHLEKFFEVRDAVAFSAICERKLFAGHFGYCNYDTYKLVIQQFRVGSSRTFAFTARRRDGASNYLWGSNEFAFHRPEHVASAQKANLDIRLLDAIAKLPKKYDYLKESIREFNSANTDSSDIPEHVELVMLKSAFERLFAIHHEASSFVSALREHLAGVTILKGGGPMRALWTNKWPKAASLVECWARDFCALRGTAAHGVERGKAQTVWGVPQHLAFASILFPLVFKKHLADKRLLALSPDDGDHLEMIEAYLVHDPFAKTRAGATHPWRKIEQQVVDVKIRRALAEALSRKKAG